MLSHRARLVLSTVAACGLLLGAVFVGVAYLFRFQAISTARESIDTSLKEILSDWKGPASAPDLAEAHESNPNISFGYFGDSKQLLARVGPLQPGITPGFEIVDWRDKTVMVDAVFVKSGSITGLLDWTSKERELRSLNLALLFLWILVELCVGAVSWYAASATFKPLQELTQQAATLSGSDLAARLHSRDGAEFGALAVQLNLLLQRIEETAKREEQFAADAAHELRTPLTTLLASLETSQLNPRSSEEYQALIGSLIPEVERLSRLVELLLRSTRSEREPASPLDLKTIVELVASRWLDRFEEIGVHLITNLASARAGIRPEELQSVLDNLLENALRYSPRGTSASITLTEREGFASITVSDQGPGVPDELVATIFDRLTTGETSRTNSSGGFGIGLAICKSIATARGGRISVENRNPGAAFTIELPQT